MKMQYATELHAHTCLVSPCADLPLEDAVQRYAESGYHTVVVTDHYCDYVIDNAGDTWEQVVTHYVSGYKAMKEMAKGKFNVLLGCELRFVGSMNDYLVLGMDEEFLLAHPELHKMSLPSFSQFARENGLLLIQAHPFRNGMTVADPKGLDGIEIFNAHNTHDSRNYLAYALAKKEGLCGIAGSDFHHPYHWPAAGIMTEDPILSEKELLDILRAGTFRTFGEIIPREQVLAMVGNP